MTTAGETRKDEEMGEKYAIGLSRFAEGLAVLAKYDPKGYVQGEHDELWMGGPTPGQLTFDDKATLERLRFTWDERTECWRAFT